MYIGVPDKPELAETYYSQFDDEFEEIDEEEEDCEGTLLATVVGAAGAEGTGEDDVGDLIQHMQTALNKEDTSTYIFMSVDMSWEDSFNFMLIHCT